MAKLTEIDEFTEEVYQLEVTDFVEGGENGVDNKPHKALANRTRWLKSKIDAFIAGTIKVKNAILADTAIKLATPIKINGINFDGSADVDFAHQYPFFRISPNQFGNISGNGMADWQHNSGVTVNIKKELVSGIQWDARSVEDREILTAMGMEGDVFFFPTMRVLSLKWEGLPIGSWLVYAGSIIARGSATSACYAKVISGNAHKHFLESVSSQWGLCGSYYSLFTGDYIHNHPENLTTAGEIEFILPATVAGIFPLDRNTPKWGFFPFVGSTIDTTI